MSMSTTVNIVALTILFNAPAAQAQFAYNDTMGDSTKSSQKYTFNLNELKTSRSGLIINPNLERFKTVTGFPTRHSGLGGSTGIGGSSFQTTSVTSESAPAFVRPTAISVGTGIISRPDVSLRFGSADSSPALTGLSIFTPGSGDSFTTSSGPDSFREIRSQVPSVFSRSAGDDFQFGE